MAVFKYTVTNKDGKKLSGNVEAPEISIAKNELNNLGFSVLSIHETTEKPEIDPSLIKFVFEATDKNAKLINGTIPSKSEEEALKKLETEYNLVVTAIWKDGSTEDQVIESRKKQISHSIVEENNVQKSLEDEKYEQFSRTKIEHVLKEINELLQKFDKDFAPNEKTEIANRINKLLRIKHSKNLEYILETAEELLEYIQQQEKVLKEKGLQEKELQLHLETKQMLDELHQNPKEKTLSEDIIEKVNYWQNKNIAEGSEPTGINKIINQLLTKIKKFFEVPAEIMIIKTKIKNYNHQIWTFIQLYFKEPTPEYKEKVKNSIKTIWRERAKAIEELKETKEKLRDIKKLRPKNENKIEEHLFISFVEELNAFSGWLLGFYVLYYFISLYLNTKDFGLNSIPSGFLVYDSQIFKYLLAIVFLIHAGTSIKLNFFRTSIVANVIIPPVVMLGTIITLLNF